MWPHGGRSSQRIRVANIVKGAVCGSTDGKRPERAENEKGPDGPEACDCEEIASTHLPLTRLADGLGKDGFLRPRAFARGRFAPKNGSPVSRPGGRELSVLPLYRKSGEESRHRDHPSGVVRLQQRQQPADVALTRVEPGRLVFRAQNGRHPGMDRPHPLVGVDGDDRA